MADLAASVLARLKNKHKKPLAMELLPTAKGFLL